MAPIQILTGVYVVDGRVEVYDTGVFTQPEDVKDEDVEELLPWQQPS